MDSDSTDLADRHLPWGFWATLGFTILILIGASIAGGSTAAIFVPPTAILKHHAGPHPLASNGLFLAVSICAAMPLTIASCLVLAGLRKDFSLREYFGFYSARISQYLKWSLSIPAFLLCSGMVTSVLGISTKSEFMARAFTTAGSVPLLLFSFVVVAPLTEEVLFRGFLFKGIEGSRLGVNGAVVLSALGWTLGHIQYNFAVLVTVFVGGLLLGTARHRSNSIYVPILMHVIWNGIATTELAARVAFPH
jgi:membrane protease YdiL (CAAX protease family)